MNNHFTVLSGEREFYVNFDLDGILSAIEHDIGNISDSIAYIRCGVSPKNDIAHIGTQEVREELNKMRTTVQTLSTEDMSSWYEHVHKKNGQFKSNSVYVFQYSAASIYEMKTWHTPDLRVCVIDDNTLEVQYEPLHK